MYDLLNYIFKEYKYKEIKDEDLNIFTLINDDSYIVSEFNLQDFVNFFDAEKTNTIIEKFIQLETQEGSYSKNTSLIIFVQVDDDEIMDFYEKNKNHIMTIEEDEYFFRKYVVVYSPKSIKSLDVNYSISKQLHTILSNDDRFNSFEKRKDFRDEEFFVALQLMIKFPFIKLVEKQRKFEPLEEKIRNNIESKQLIQQNVIAEELMLEFEKNDEFFEELENAMLNMKEDSEIIEKFYLTLEEEKYEN